MSKEENRSRAIGHIYASIAEIREAMTKYGYKFNTIVDFEDMFELWFDYEQPDPNPDRKNMMHIIMSNLHPRINYLVFRYARIHGYDGLAENEELIEEVELALDESHKRRTRTAPDRRLML